MVFYSNQREKFMNLQELERIVAEILQRAELTQGIERYQELLYLLKEKHVNVADDEHFQHLYRNFYALSHRVAPFYPAYFNAFQDALTTPDMSHREIFDTISEISHFCEISFSSKILHNLNQNIPIYDSIVGWYHFGFKFIKSQKLDFAGNKQIAWDMYLEYKKQFMEYMESNDAKLIVQMFDDAFPQYKTLFTAVKKVDFVLWQDRIKVDGNIITRIQIPDQYKCQQ